MKHVFQEAFTLVEVLVSIAVLAIIVAIVIVSVNPVKRINAAKDTTTKTDVGQIVNALQRHYSNTEKYTYPQKLEELQGNELKTVPKQQTGAYDCSGNPTTAEAQEYCYAVNPEGTAAALWGTTWGEAEIPATASAGTTPTTTTTRAYYWCWDSATGSYRSLTDAPATVPTDDDPACPVEATPTTIPTPTSILAILTSTPTPSPTTTSSNPTSTPTPTTGSIPFIPPILDLTLTPTPTPTTVPPVCSSAGPDDVVETTANHTVYAYGVENATSVTFPTWSDIEDQDDVVWYPGSNLGGGTWTATIPHSSHSPESLDWGEFNTYAYLNNADYEYILCDTANFVWAAPTPIPCSVSTSPSVANLTAGGTTGTVTATITGLGTASVTQVRFGSYNTSVATVNPASDASSPYSTIVTALTAGNTAVWATADLNDGRVCQSTGTTDTDINVVNPTSTPTPIPTNTPTPTNTPIPTPTRTPTPTPTSTSTPTPTRTPTPTPSLQSPATFYATSSDGFIAAFSNVYLTAHNATTGTVYNNYSIYVGQVYSSNNYQIYRSGLFFDTSALPDNATITSAKVSLYLPSGYDLSITDFVLDLVWGGFLDNPLVAADYSDLPKGGPTGLVLGSTNTSGLISEGWNDISVSCCSPFSGIAWISKTGITQFGLMSSRDVNSNAPTGNEYVVFQDYDRGSTSTGPRLIISFTIP
jgi:prepilin-type N-terminal cleavage/methylation domain-containing protein